MGVAGKTSSIPDLKSLLPFINTNRRTKTFAYTFVVAFIVCTAFLAFSSSTNAFNTIFAPSSTARSQVSNLVLYFFPNSSSPAALPALQNTVQKPTEDTELRVGSVKNESGIEFQGNGGLMKNQTAVVISPKNGVSVGKNQTAQMNDTVLKNGVQVKNQTGSQETRTPAKKKETVEGTGSQENGDPMKNQTGSQETRTPAKKNQPVEAAGSLGSKDSRTNVQKNETGSPENGVPAKNQTDSAVEELKKKATVEGMAAPSPAWSNGGQKTENWMDKLMGCDIFDGRWVHDDSYPLYPPGSCPYIDEQFDCHHNGRPDEAYLKYRWQPNGCDIPRLNATDMLERLRRRRLVFVGDSLNRNMWESLVCALKNSVKDKTKVFEASGRKEFRTEGAYSFVFKDYGCSVEFFQSPFLVQEWLMPDKNGSKRETLRLDVVDHLNSRYKDAYAIIFNTGHWWTHEKTSQGKDYYQEGNHVYDVLNVDEAFHKALNTWARWVDTNVNPKRSHVFFRGYSASHFSGGQWNSGGQCDRETGPIDNDKYLTRYPQKMNILEDVIKGMRTPVAYMNITRMTDYRKDGHPSFYRTTVEERAPDQIQDCSHWCLPGVPDAWNELLYSQLLIEQHRMQH